MPQIIIKVPRHATETTYGSRIVPPEAEPESGFDAFEGRASKLVQTPKSEVDEQHEKS